MAFSYTVKKRDDSVGTFKVVTGTYTNESGDTGGDIKTGLHRVYHIDLQPTGSSVVATQGAVNETMPLAGGTVTVVTADDEDGTWIAFGE